MSHNPADRVCVCVNTGVWPSLLHTGHKYLASQHAYGSEPPEASNVHSETLVASPPWKPETCLSCSAHVWCLEHQLDEQP